MPRKKSETEKAKKKKVVRKVRKITKKEVEEKAGKATKKELEEKAGKISKKEPEEKAGKRITKKELEEKAKKLAAKIKTEDIKEKLEEAREKEKERKKTLVLIEDYVKSGIYIGTKVITPHLRPFVYRRRNDGIAIINTNIIDEKLKEAAELLAKYEPQDFIVVCKREAGWQAIEKFSELTGVRVFTKKYPAGILTNPALPDFFEVDMIFICDPWLDKNALNDAKKIKKKIFSLCDTNNYTFDIDFFVPCNNKASKSLGLIFYILTREYLKARGVKKKVKREDFVELE